MSGQAPHGGAADAYFNGQDDIGLQQRGYQQNYQQPQQQYAPPPQQYGQPQYQQNGQFQQQGNYQQQPQQQQYPPQPPPGYGKPPPMQQDTSGKQDFSQAFKVDKPKYNDLWAAILFILTFAGFIAVSALSIQGYSSSRLFQGGSIYGGAKTVGLSTNTIILL